MGLRGIVARVAVGGTLALSVVAVTGCAGNPAPEIGPWSTSRCVDDSPACIAERQRTLKALLSDRERRWVREPANADSYAGGVRLFAFKTRKRELTCQELAAARREAEAGPTVLRGPGGRHLTPAQVSRGAMLSTEVSRELAGEMRRRCPV